MKEFIVVAILKKGEDVDSGVVTLKPHLELYTTDYYWKNVAGRSDITFVATLTVKDDDIVFFDPNGDLTPDDALVQFDEDNLRPVKPKKESMEKVHYSTFTKLKS